MAKPVAVHSWNFSTNNQIGASEDPYKSQNVAFLFLTMLLRPEMNFNVVRSSDGDSSSNSNLWTSLASIQKMETSKRLWIILKRDGQTTTDDMWCILYFPSSNKRYFRFSIVAKEPVGGDETTVPSITSIDQMEFDRSEGTDFNIHYLTESNGKSFRFVVTLNGGVSCGVLVDFHEAKNNSWSAFFMPRERVGSPTPSPFNYYGDITVAVNMANSVEDGSVHSRDVQGEYSPFTSWTSNTTIFDRSDVGPNTLGGFWDTMPITAYMSAYNNIGLSGFLGYARDLWAVPDDSTDFKVSPSIPTPSTGATLMPSGSNDFIIFGKMLMPWDGSNPIVNGILPSNRVPLEFYDHSGGDRSFIDGQTPIINADVESVYEIRGDFVDTPSFNTGSFDLNRYQVTYAYNRGRRVPKGLKTDD